MLATVVGLIGPSLVVLTLAYALWARGRRVFRRAVFTWIVLLVVFCVFVPNLIFHDLGPSTSEGMSTLPFPVAVIVGAGLLKLSDYLSAPRLLALPIACFVTTYVATGVTWAT